MTNKSPLALMSLLVDELLNNCCSSMISKVFQENFVDYDPIEVPALQTAGSGGLGGIQGIHTLMAFLSQPGVDFRFVLEDAFGDEDRVAYRLFGEGQINLVDSVAEAGGDASDRLRRLDGSTLVLQSTGAPIGTVVGNRYQVVLRRVGIYRIAGSRFAEHWGQLRIA